MKEQEKSFRYGLQNADRMGMLEIEKK